MWKMMMKFWLSFIEIENDSLESNVEFKCLKFIENCSSYIEKSSKQIGW